MINSGVYICKHAKIVYDVVALNGDNVEIHAYCRASNKHHKLTKKEEVNNFIINHKYIN